MNNFQNLFSNGLIKHLKIYILQISKVNNSVESLINRVNTGISKFNENLKNIGKETLLITLIEIKNSFISFKNGMDDSKAVFDAIKKEITQLLEEMEKLD